MAAVRLLLRPSLPFFPFLVLLILSPFSLSSPESDTLLKLKASFTNAKSLDSWNPDSTPCTGKIPWIGVVCFNGNITGLRLGKMGLSGNIDVDALNQLPGLRTLSFVNNNFSGKIPNFNHLGSLKSIYLSQNKFSGEIPSDYFSKMGSLKKVWLSGNEFTGKIPISLSKLPHLIELHLENNQFYGSIPLFEKSVFVSFNVSNNNLEGQIPSSLSKFGQSSFAGNDELCGEQLENVCDAAMGTSPSDNILVTKNWIVSLVVLGLLLLFVVGAAIMNKRKKEEFDVLGRENLDESVEVHVTSGSQRRGNESSRKGSDSSRQGGSSHGKGNAMGDLVMVNEEKGVFGLPDLMKAAAEVLGNGGLGSSYKAVMGNGVAVVVKRMRDMNKIGRDGFCAEMRRFGKLRHQNILTPLAYHYRKEEKLLISEYVPKGSLLYLLHGDRGPCHAELDWPARVKIVQGIARGMSYLNTEFTSLDLPHGNLKSSNILLGPDYEPLLSDYGFSSVVTPTQAAQAMFAYKSPESIQYHQVTPKCDVYCLGIVILEILTGKFPSQYLNNGKGGTDVVQWVQSAISEKREPEVFDPEIASSKSSHGEMEQLLHIGAACTEQNPEKRLDLKEAIRRIEEIQIKRSQDDRAASQIAPSLGDGYTEMSLSESSRDRS